MWAKNISCNWSREFLLLITNKREGNTKGHEFVIAAAGEWAAESGRARAERAWA